MWNECETSTCAFFSFIYQHNQISLSCASFISFRSTLNQFVLLSVCTHHCHHHHHHKHPSSSSSAPSLLTVTPVCPSCDSKWVVLYDRRLKNWKWRQRKREGERGYSWWNRETSSHYDKQERKKAATFSKCHFGNFQLNSDNNSLSSTLGCLDALFSAQLKTILWCCGEENSKNTFLLWLEQYKVHSNPEALSELS